MISLAASLLLVTLSTRYSAGEGLPPGLTAQIDLLRRSKLTDSIVVDSLESLLREAGFLDACVTISGDSLIVEPELQFDLDAVHITGDTSATISVKRPFRQPIVESVMDSIVAQYRDRGYYFSSLKIERADMTDDGVSLSASLNRGPLSRIGRMHYEGLKRTRADLVDRYLTAAPGDTITAMLLRDIESDATAIPFLTFQPPLRVVPTPGYGAVDIVVPFREKQQFRFEGGAGYASGDEAGAVWSFALGLNNLFGGGRDLVVQSQRPDRGRSELNVRYRQPLMLLGRGALQVEVATRDYRDEFNDFSISGAFETRLRSGLGAQVSLEWKTVTQQEPSPSYSKYALGFGVSQTSVDNSANPSRGYDFSSSAGFAHRRYAASDDEVRAALNETRLKVSSALYLPLETPLGMHLAVGYDGLNSPEELPPAAELIRIGGPPYLRGFRTQQFAVLRAAYGTLEPYWRFAQGKLFVFCDGAYLFDRRRNEDDHVVSTEDYEYGYGFGFSLVTAGGGVRLSLGWNDELAFDTPRLSVELATDL